MVRLRIPIVCLWIAGAGYVTQALPTISSAQVGSLGDLVPTNAPAIKAERTSDALFGFPLISRTILVQHRPQGLSPAAQARVLTRAGAIDQHRYSGLSAIAGAIPFTNTLGKPPFSRQNSTTALTYLFFGPGVSARRKLALSHRLAAQRIAQPGDGYVGVTGSLPARHAQSTIVSTRLALVEIATLLLVLLVVGLYFRSPGAPLATLAAVAIAYLVSVRVIAFIGEKIGVSVPSEVEPVLLVLMFGVITDYSVFFLSRMRRLLGDGLPRLDAARRTTQEIAPIVATAGTTIVLATLSLIVAKLGFLQAFGPGLAMAIVIAMLVSLTLIPALLAIAGGWLFWPTRPGRDVLPGRGREEPQDHATERPRRTLTVRLAAEHPRAVLIGTVLGLVAATSGITQTSVADPLVRGLPDSAGAKRAYTAASQGFAPGILAPTVLVLRAPGIRTSAGRRAAARLQSLLEQQPGVAAVAGPASDPVKLDLGAAVSKKADAVRYVMIFDADPLGSRAISVLSSIQRAGPRLLARAGLSHAKLLYAGDTALVQETVNATMADLGRVGPVVLSVVLLMLAVFLRSLVAPLYLVFASLLALGAAFGIGTYVFQYGLGYGDVTYYVPFAAAVLLIALGSDYNVFVVGRIWQEARHRPLREAIVVGGAGAARAITVAGLILGCSFGLLAIIDVQSFRELAIVMGLGLIIDTLVVRTLLVPALIALFGHRGGWPGKGLQQVRQLRPVSSRAEPEVSPIALPERPASGGTGTV